MIKRLTKTKKSKQGAILVIVVLILALAMIFIASAMMLTQATRTRLYENTVQSQARLTVTSVSEVFLEALKTQEITDTQLEKLINKTHASGSTKIKMVVQGVPGMSEDPKNCTWLDIYTNAADSKRVYCDFTTVIGDSVENVQVVLKAEESNPTFGSQFKNQVEVAGGVGIGELRFTRSVGMWDSSKISRPNDNNIVLRGGYVGQTSGSIYISDVVFGQSSTNIKLGGSEKFYGRMVFLEGAQMNCRSGADVYGDVYLIGSKSTPTAGLALKDSSQGGLWNNLEGKKNNFVFSGRSVQNDTNDTNEWIYKALTKDGTHKIYFVKSDGTSAGATPDIARGKNGKTYDSNDYYTITNSATSSLTTTITNSVVRYQGWNYSSSNPFPDAPSVFKTLCPDGDCPTSDGTVSLSYATYSPTGEYFAAGSTIPEGKKYIANPVTTTYPSYRKDEDGNPQYTLYIDEIDESVDLEPGYYYITSKGPAGSIVKGGAEAYRDKPIVIGIDGEKADEYRFYFAQNRHFILRGIVFAIYNASSSKPVYFILESGARVQLSHNNDGVNRICSAGFLSVPNRKDCDTFDDLVDYVQTKNYTVESHTVTNSEYKDHNGSTVSVTYSEYYDNKVRPSMFIYGVGDNVICLGKSVTIEAYIGLYGGSSFGPIDGSGERQTIYGRIECEAFHTFANTAWDTGTYDDVGKSVSNPTQDHPVGDFCMPYCPQPSTTSSMPQQRIAKSKYSVEDITYYY